MKRYLILCSVWLVECAFVTPVKSEAASLPPDWKQQQSFQVASGGLVKIALPADTLSSARPALEDLRLYDSTENEVPYLIERSALSSGSMQAPRSFQVSLNPRTTVITLEVDGDRSVNKIALETPAQNFIKAVTVEGSTDGRSWRPLARGQPIFRQPAGAAQNEVAFPIGSWHWFKLTVDDQRSAPLPFTGAMLGVVKAGRLSGEWSQVAISGQDESPGETRLALNLGAANLNLASIHLETAEPLFMRQVSIAVPRISEGILREETIGQSAVYRVELEGQGLSENLSMPLNVQIPSRELLLLIKNGNSPPLHVSAVRVERHPIYLIFLARQPGAYRLLTGNPRCAEPRYDLAALGIRVNQVKVLPVQMSPPSPNPDFHASQVLPGIETTGSPLDISTWRFRKSIKISGGAAYQLELDLDVLAHAQQGLGDLRILRGENQVPYILQPTSMVRAITPTVEMTHLEEHSTRSKSSRWAIKLPRSGLPLTRLISTSRTPLFERSMSLYEEISDARGEKYNHPLASAVWTQTPELRAKELVLPLQGPPHGDTLFLETENGDNPPIELTQFSAFYPVTRLLFLARPGDDLRLYYGNSDTSPPHYDLGLVADQLLAADKQEAQLSSQEQLREGARHENQTTSRSGGFIFWGVLALVVVVLLIVTSRLLPAAQPPQ